MSKVLFNIAYTCATPPAKYRGNARVEYARSRQFHDMTAEYNYLSYVLNDEKVEKNKDSLDYYTRSGSNTGLFNMDGKMDEEQINALKKKLSKSESIIWHGFVSFDAETSKGFNTQEKAIKFLKHSFGSFIENSHLKRDNVEVFAALHTDTPKHHHIHFSFFEKEPKHRDKNGKLSYTKKGGINQNVIENYLVAANMHVSENSYEYYTARDRAMAKLRALKGKVLATSEKSEFKRNLLVLADKLPKTGRLQYNSSNMKNLRAEIDTVANMLVRSNPEALEAHYKMQRVFAAKEQEVIELARENKLAYINGRRLSKDEIKAATEEGKELLGTQFIDLKKINYIDKLREDYKARLGNHVLGLCREMKKEFRQSRRAKVNDKELKIKARRKRARSTKVLHNFIKALDGYQKGVAADFTRSLKEIEREIEMQKAN